MHRDHIGFGIPPSFPSGEFRAPFSWGKKWPEADLSYAFSAEVNECLQLYLRLRLHIVVHDAFKEIDGT